MVLMYNELVKIFTQKNNNFHTKVGMRDTLVNKLDAATKRIAVLEKEFDEYTKASLFLQTLSDTTRQKVLDRISSIVTDALQQIKDPNLEFRMNLTTERNQNSI